MQHTTYKANWAVVGTGNIVKKFIIGLRAAAGAQLYAVVSRSGPSAEAFAKAHEIPHAYGDYAAALQDKAVDIVYIGTPHPTHADYVCRALAAGKAVLCEKTVTINAGEMQRIADTAAHSGRFFMEAMWTRFLPAVRTVRDWIAAGMIGDVRFCQGNFGFVVPWQPQSRLLAPKLGGGALLDAGIYPLSFASMVFGGDAPENISGQLTFCETGVDDQFAGTFLYSGGRMASINAALRTQMKSDFWIYGTQGRICLPDFVFGRSATLYADGKFTQQNTPPFVSNGYNYEAEEVMHCLAAGKRQSDVMPIAESLSLMRQLDEVRRQNHFLYPGE